MNTSDVQITATLDTKQVEMAVGKLNKSLKQATVPFAGYAMSIMFFGMAMQRTFSQITRFGTKAFQDVMHSVEGTVTNTDLLNSSFTYLGFTIGQALEPVIGFLIPIIDAVAEWVNQHPKLTAGIVSVGTVLGALFAVGGAGVLAINGFIELGSRLGLVTLDAKGAVSSVKDLTSALSKVGGAIAITFAFSSAEEAFKDFSDAQFGDGLFNAISAGVYAAGGYKLLKGTGGGWLIALGFAVDQANKGTLFQNSFSIMGLIVAPMLAGFDLIVNGYRNMIAIISGKSPDASMNFAKLFKARYNDIQNQGKQLDSWISQGKGWLNAEQNTTYNINIASMNTVSPGYMSPLDIVNQQILRTS